MQFTVVFDMKYNLGDGSYSIRYHSAAIWMQGDKVLPVKIKNSPIYESGGLRPLLEYAQLNDDTLNSEEVVIVRHSGGHGTKKCLENLVQDLLDESFKPISVNPLGGVTDHSIDCKEVGHDFHCGECESEMGSGRRCRYGPCDFECLQCGELLTDLMDEDEKYSKIYTCPQEGCGAKTGWMPWTKGGADEWSTCERCWNVGSDIVGM
ncbi:hypothetical protein OAJ94_01115 [Deltaproteobacteria bacterium]|nr:hypothetical protein [Deltaproteobacteria bacterium]